MKFITTARQLDRKREMKIRLWAVVVAVIFAFLWTLSALAGSYPVPDLSA